MWEVNYNITFELDNGKRIKKSNSMIIKNLNVTSHNSAKEYVLKKYTNGFQPLVDMDDIFGKIVNKAIEINKIEELSN